MFDIPNVPPSVNACYRATGSRVYKSQRLRQYEEQMKVFFADDSDPIQRLEGRLQLTVKFSFKGHRKRDLDNLLKPLLDSLEGVLFENDNQLFEIRASKEYGAQQDGTTVLLTQLAD